MDTWDDHAWRAQNQGLPQRFRIGDLVIIKNNLPIKKVQIVGASKDNENPGRVCYVLQDYPDMTWPEDNLEAA